MKRCKWFMMSSVLLLSMWSCSSDNDAPENGEEVPILLSSSFSSATRAGGHEDEIDPEATAALRNFWVYGYKTVAGNDIQMMNQQLVSRDAAGSPWTYSPLKYWDRAASNYLFVGYVPNTNVEINEADKKLTFSNIPQWQKYSESVNTEDGIQTVYNSDANDYMVARSTDTPGNYLSSTNPGVVHLDFYHLLAKLTIKAYCRANNPQADETLPSYVVSKVSLNTIGTYQDNQSSTHENESLGLPYSNRQSIWTYTEPAANQTLLDNNVFGSVSGIDKTKSQDLFSKTQESEYIKPAVGDEGNPPTTLCSWLIAPFNLNKAENDGGISVGYSSNSCFTLNVTYYTRTKSTENDEYVYVEHTTATPLKLVDKDDGKAYFDKFEMNKEYVVTLKIDKQGVEILVDVAVTPWLDSATEADPHDVYNW